MSRLDRMSHLGSVENREGFTAERILDRARSLLRFTRGANEGG